MIQIARDLGYTVVERDIARAELYLAEEIFLTGTAAELVPVREIDDHELGEPGEITRRCRPSSRTPSTAAPRSTWSGSIRSSRPRARRASDAAEVAARGPVESLLSARIRASERITGAAAADRAAPGRRQASAPTLEPERHLMEQVKLYDTTLRDGMQGPGMSLSAREKVRVVRALDELGVQLIEAGFPSSNPKEAELFELLAEVELRAGDDLRLRDDPPPRRRPPRTTRRCALLVGCFAPVVHPGRQDLGPAPREGDQGLAARRTWR